MARMRWLGASVAAACAFACGTQGLRDPDGGSISKPTVVVPVHLPPTPLPACPPLGPSGSIVATIPITGGATVATDAAGDVFYTADRGIVKLAPDLHQVYAYPYGTVLAVDAAGNAFVAGAFTQPIDLGGRVITPNGDIDVFLAELSPHGDLIFSTALGVCSDGVQSIAIARDGRISVSGDAMGTVILDASGKLLMQLGFSGQLAFDGNGNLVVGGVFADELDIGGGHTLRSSGPLDSDGFVVKIDPDGRPLFALSFGDAPLPLTFDGLFGRVEVTTPQVQRISHIAIGADDDVALIGTYIEEMSLFDRVATMSPSFPSGRLAGDFVVKLDPSGTMVRFALDGAMLNAAVPPGGIAIDTAGNVLTSTNIQGNAGPPFAYPQLDKTAPYGTHVFGFFNQAGRTGQGLGVATDACSTIFWATNEFVFDPSGPFPQSFLREVAP